MSLNYSHNVLIYASNIFHFSAIMKRLVLLASLLISIQLRADPYPMNPNIDILHYRFQVQLFDDTDQINGQATVTAKFLAAGMKELVLDLINTTADQTGMRVDSVRQDHQVIRFKHVDNRLTLTLPVPTTAGEQQSFTIYYQGTPATGLIIGPNKYGDRTFFSDNWPNKARNWLPTVDHISDKATSEMIIEAPVRYQVISNGLLLEETNLDDLRKRSHWKQSVPISCWLYVLGVAEFAVQYVDEFEGKSIQTWVYKQDRSAGFYDFAVPTKRTLQFFSDYVGPFQYEKLANIQANSVGGGMEAASAILYGDRSVTGSRSTRWRNVIIHEVAHQWFGNAVTESSWDDVWLSEGFATYFTLLFREYAYGRADFIQGLQESRSRVYAFYRNHKDYTIVHDNLRDMSQVTSGQTYQKGAWILHMLRDLLSDAAFQEGIHSYYTRYVNGTASTQDLQQEMESASGMDLEPFFQQWLYGGGHIILEANWRYLKESKEVEIVIEQVQTDGNTFEFPIEFGLYGSNELTPKITRAQCDAQQQTFRIPVDKKPVSVLLDPRTVLLAEWTLKETK